MTSAIRGLLPGDRSGWLLSLGTLADAIGLGLFVTVSTIFFTRSVGLSVSQVGAGLSVAGLVGFAMAVPIGRLADHFGPRGVSVVIALVQAAVMASYVVVRSFWAFLLVVVLFSLAESGSYAARQVLVGQLARQGSRVRMQAYQRSVLNVGIAVGALGAGVALQADRRSIYLLAILLNAGSFLALAVFTALLEPTPPPPAPEHAAKRASAFRDPPFMLLGLLNGLLGLHASVLMIGLPLWVTLHTKAPRGLIAVLFVANTVLTVILQVRMSRGSDTVPGAARALVWSGAASAVACLLFAPTASLSAVGAILAISLATVALTAGELLQSAGGWGLSFGLAPEAEQGSFFGAFSLGYAVRDGLGPILVTGLVISSGAVGWLGLAGAFLILGAAVLPISRWASVRRRTVAGSVTDVAAG
jgi:MFS family permease